MEFPFGRHHHHHHHHHGDEEEDDSRRHQHAGVYPPPGVHHASHDRGYDPPAGVHHVSHDRGYDPPPPFSGSSTHHDRSYVPPPGVQHVYPPPGVQHASHDRGYNPPPPFAGDSARHLSHEPGLGYAPPPSLIGADVVPPYSRPFAGAPVQQVAHETPYGYQPGYAEHVSHESWDGGALNQLPTVRIYTKAEENYSLSIRDGKVILELKNPSDKRQHWIKDLKYSTKIKDKEGFPAFALVNKATGEAIKHSLGETKPVSLVPYNPNSPDVSVLWTESKDLGDGFRCIRMVNNILLNFDAFNGDEQHGGVHDGTYIVLWEWLKGKNQRWKIVPYC